ncbi:MAG: hypothetical protein GX881_08015 [Firmicutes bacterium]|nr:hypothetical protein [Bacillota bacterium]
MDILFSYPRIPIRIKELKEERANVAMMLMPKAGASLVRVRTTRGWIQDSTGCAGVDLAEHPTIARIDRQIDFHLQRKAQVEQLLSQLTKKELRAVELCFFGAEITLGKSWGFGGGSELSRTRESVTKKAARLWGLEK